MHARLAIAPVLALLVAPACGGSDSDSAPGPASEQAQKDVTPPQVVALTPAPGDDDVWVHGPITATFSEPVRAPADRTVVLALPGGDSIETTVQRSQDGKSLTIVPDTLPPPSTQVTVNFRAPIADLAGNAASIPAWSWIVPQWQRMAPPLRAGGDGYTSVELAAGRDGSVLVADQLSLDKVTSMYLSVSKLENGAWIDLKTPQHGGGTSGPYLGSPTVIGVDGMPLVAQRSASELRVDRFDGTAWSPLAAPPVAGDIVPLIRSVRMVLDSSGRPVLAWGQQVSGSTQTIAVARWDGSAWQLLGNVSMMSTMKMFELAAGANGALSLAASDGSTLAIAGFDGTSWVRTNRAKQSVRELSLAFDEDGTEVVACIDQAGAVHVLRSAESNYSPGFLELGASPSSSAYHVAIRSRPSGRPGTRLVLSFLDAGPNVLGWDGEGWVSLSREIATPTRALYTAENVGSSTLVVSPQGELVYAWAENNVLWPLLDLHVVRYNE